MYTNILYVLLYSLNFFFLLVPCLNEGVYHRLWLFVWGKETYAKQNIPGHSFFSHSSKSTHMLLCTVSLYLLPLAAPPSRLRTLSAGFVRARARLIAETGFWSLSATRRYGTLPRRRRSFRARGFTCPTAHAETPLTVSRPQTSTTIKTSSCCLTRKQMWKCLGSIKEIGVQMTTARSLERKLVRYLCLTTGRRRQIMVAAHPLNPTITPWVFCSQTTRPSFKCNQLTGARLVDPYWRGSK